MQPGNSILYNFHKRFRTIKYFAKPLCARLASQINDLLHCMEPFCRYLTSKSMSELLRPPFQVIKKSYLNLKSQQANFGFFLQRENRNGSGLTIRPTTTNSLVVLCIIFLRIFVSITCSCTSRLNSKTLKDILNPISNHNRERWINNMCTRFWCWSM